MAAVNKNVCSAAAWVISTSYSVGDRRTNDSSKLYKCTTAGTSAGAGGPTGTGTGISDGSCVWDYIATIDYSTWASAETASDSASGSDAWTFTAYLPETILSAKVSWSGYTGTAGSLVITVAAGDSFIDHASYATNPRKYDAAKGYGVANTANTADTFFFSEAHTLSRFQLRSASSSTGSRPYVSDNNSANAGIVKNCLAQADGPHPAVFDLFRAVNKAINCIAVSNVSGGTTRGFWVSSGNAYNCTAFRPSGVGGSGYGFDSELYVTGSAKNCVSFGFGTPFSTTGSGFDAASNYNCSDGTSPGASSLSGKTATNNYQSLDISNSTFGLIKTSPTDIVAGTRDATNTADLDIFGRARSTTTPTMGAEEYVVPPSAVDLTIADATHSHTADSPTLTTASTLAVQDATHAHTADNLTLTTSGAVDLTIADASHAHTADSPTLTLGYVDLTIADALHGHTADSLTLSISGAANLVIQDATHGHAADSLTLSIVEYTDLVIARAMHGHTSDNLTLGGLYTDLELILKILRNRQELNASTGLFTLYDDDSVSVLYTASAWADAAGTTPYSGGTLGRIDALA